MTRSDRGRRGARARRGAPDRERDVRDTGNGEIVEGFHAVRELLRAGARTVYDVWLVEDTAGAAELAALAHEQGIRVRPVSATQLAARARSEAPQGVIARAAPVPAADVDALLGDPDAFLVAVDGVTDPGNLGAILRTAETAGVTGVVIARQRAARLGPTTLKAAAGAVEHLPVAFVGGIPGFLDQARRGRRVVRRARRRRRHRRRRPCRGRRPGRPRRRGRGTRDWLD